MRRRREAVGGGGAGTTRRRGLNVVDGLMAQPQNSAQRPGQSQTNDAGAAGTAGTTGASAAGAQSGMPTGVPTGVPGGTQGRATSGPAGEPRSDQERQRQVSREDAGMGTAAGTGVQRGARQGAALAGGRGQGQPSVLPALMSNPWLMTNAFMANPFGFAQAMSQEMDRLFASSFGDVSPYGQGGTSGQSSRSLATQGQQSRGLGQWMPQVEVRQRGNELVVSADLPGLKPEDVDIEIDDGILTISGERRQSSEDRDQGVYRSERSYGAFTRSIALPEGVDEDQVQARFEHGVLEVTVPVPQQRQRARRVQIQPGSGSSSVGSPASGQTAGQQRSGQAASASSSDRSPGAAGSFGTN
jgi:HSP20 family protein